MTTIKDAALTLAVILFALAATAQAQTARLSTVNVTSDGERVRVAAQGDVYEMRVDVADEAGEVVFQSGAIAGNQLDWKMKDARGERVTAGAYLVTVTFRTAAGKLRKRVEQVSVDEVEKSGTQASAVSAPNAVQATITGSGTTNRLAKFTGASTIGDTTITATSGKVGIGTTAPTTTLTVVGAQVNNPAVLADNDSSGGIGVKGRSNNDTGIGVWGLHLATTGTTPGLKGETNSADANAVAILGVVNPTSAGDQSAAIKGINNDTTLLGCGVCGTPIGVWGEQAKYGYGVYGFAPDGVGVYGNSTSGFGVYAQSGSGVGVTGNSSDNDGVSGTSSTGKAVHGTSAMGYAGYFDGKVKITGILEADGGCTGCGGISGAISDRNLKANFSTVSPRFILDRLATVPIQTWNYKGEPTAVRHIGAMAQDFRAAFGFGESDKTLHTVDANGVTMAAIQGLYQQNQELTREVRTLKAELQHLQRTVKRQRVRRKR